MKKIATLTLVLLLGLTASCGSDSQTRDAQPACFSPTANLSSAGQQGAQGCACNAAVDKDVCVQGKALFCSNGHWVLGVDGRCMPGPDAGPRVDAPLSPDTAPDIDTRQAPDAPSDRTPPTDPRLPVDLGPTDTQPLDSPLSCSLDSSCPTGTTCNAGQVCVACFTPTINTELISLDNKNPGCPCDDKVDRGVCLRGVAVMCVFGHWAAGVDGPCMPSPDGGSKVDTAPLADAPPSCSADSACPSGTRCNAGTGCVACFTPTLNTELITLGSQQGCSCNPQVEQAACVRGVAVMCSIDHWITALDGPCMPSPDGGKSSG